MVHQLTGGLYRPPTTAVAMAVRATAWTLSRSLTKRMETSGASCSPTRQMAWLGNLGDRMASEWKVLAEDLCADELRPDLTDARLGNRRKFTFVRHTLLQINDDECALQQLQCRRFA